MVGLQEELRCVRRYERKGGVNGVEHEVRL